MELTIDEALQQGLAAHKEGKLQDAERFYRAILQSQPAHPDANHNLGVIAISVNQAEAALPMFKTALEANPKILMINNRPIAAIPEEPSKTYQQGSVNVTLDWWKRHRKLRDWKEQPDRVLISASCVEKPEDLQRLMEIPCDACLVGNSAMTAKDRITYLKSLRGGSPT